MIHIAICAGGFSSEYDVSVNSAKQVKKALEGSKYAPWVVEISRKGWVVELDGAKTLPVDKNDFSFFDGGQKIKFHAAFMAIHGTPGEDGKLQSYFDLIGLPHTTCNSFVAQLTFNKKISKMMLRPFEIAMAKEVLVRSNEKPDPREILDVVGLPCFVKPNNSGSSFGVTKVLTEEDLEVALETGYKEDKELLIEEFIEGTEVTCGVYKAGDKKILFPVTEIVSKTGFFDYEAKYTPGMSDEITPARISEEDTKVCQELASKIYDIFNCDGIVRVDFILKNGTFYFLEINTVPGMSENSIIPKQIHAAGYSVSEIYSMVLDNVLNF